MMYVMHILRKLTFDISPFLFTQLSSFFICTLFLPFPSIASSNFFQFLLLIIHPYTYFHPTIGYQHNYIYYSFLCFLTLPIPLRSIIPIIMDPTTPSASDVIELLWIFDNRDPFWWRSTVQQHRQRHQNRYSISS